MEQAIEKKNKFGNTLMRIMLIFLAIMPFGYSCITIANNLSHSWDTNGVLYIICIAAISVFLILIISRTVSEKASPKSRTIMVLSIFAVAFVCRTIVAVLLQTKPVSDFERCFRYALSQSTEQEEWWMTMYPYLGAYALTLKAFFAFVPNTLFSAQVINAIVASGTAVLLYLGAEKMIANSRTAFIAGMSCACYPGLIVYSAITSCEHFSQFFFALGLYFWAWENRTPWCEKKKKVPLLIATGVSFGFMCVYKELFIVVAPAMVMAGFCYEMLPQIGSALKKEKNSLLKTVIKYAFVVIAVFFTFKGTVAAVQVELSGTTYSQTTTIGKIVYQGLTPSAGGEWSAEVKAICEEISAEASSAAEENKLFFSKLQNEYNGDINQLIDVILRKIRIDFCDEGVYWNWTVNQEADNYLQGTWIGELLFSLLPSAVWMIMCAILAIGLFAMVWDRYGNIHFFVTGVVFLFVLMLTLMEAQGRYKSNIMPFICVLYALSVEKIFEIRKIANRFPKLNRGTGK